MPSRRDILRGAAGMAALAAGGVTVRAQTPRAAQRWEAREVDCQEAADALTHIRDPRRWLCTELTGCSGDDAARVARRQKAAIRRCEESPDVLRVVSYRDGNPGEPGVFIAAAESTEPGPPRTIESIDCHIDQLLTGKAASTAFRVAAIETLRIAAERGYSHHAYTHPGEDEPSLAFADWRWRDWADIAVTPLASDRRVYAWLVSGPIPAFVRAYTVGSSAV